MTLNAKETQAGMPEFRRYIAKTILQLLQEEALASGADCPQAFGFLIPREAAAPALASGTDSAFLCADAVPHGSNADKSAAKTGGLSLYAELPFLYYNPEILLQEFRADSEKLLARYRAVCLDAWDAQCALQRAKAGGAPGYGKKGSASDEEQIQPEQPARMNYRKFLQRFCIPREEAVPDLDSFDYIPYLYGLSRPGKLMLVEPLEYSEVNRLDELAIAIDTSASCRQAQVRRFLEETWSILRQKENFFSHMRLHLIQCDSMIEDYRIFTDVREWEETLPSLRIQGRGSTDFCPVFDLLTEKLRTKEIRSLRALLYFTDGDGVYPRRKPPFDTAFVFLNRESEKGEPPDWIIRLNLDENTVLK